MARLFNLHHYKDLTDSYTQKRRKYYTKYKNSSKIPEIQYHCLLAAIPKPVPRYMALFPMEA